MHNFFKRFALLCPLRKIGWSSLAWEDERIKSQLKTIPENVFVFNRVPQLEVLSQTDLSINHGGIHTIHECIHCGVPMLVYSGKKHDQNGCAARVAYHHLGMKADKDLDQPEDIRQKIIQVLQTKKYSENIARMRATFEHYTTQNTLHDALKHIAPDAVH